MKGQKAKLIAMAALAACVYAAGAAPLGTNETAMLVNYLYTASEPGCVDIFEQTLPEDCMTISNIAIRPITKFAEDCGISTNDAFEGVYCFLDSNWEKAQAVWRNEAQPSSAPGGIDETSLRAVFHLCMILGAMPDSPKKAEYGIKALQCPHPAIVASALEDYLKTPVSTNGLFMIHDIFSNSVSQAFSEALNPLKFDSSGVLAAAASTNAVFKDRLNRLDWFLADKFPARAYSFDKRLFASVSAYGMSIQRLALYNKMRESDFACGKTNLWYEFSQPTMDQLTSVPTNELNDVSAALAW